MWKCVPPFKVFYNTDDNFQNRFTIEDSNKKYLNNGNLTINHDRIFKFIKLALDSKLNENNTDFYNHFNHLLIHSLLHINGYDHQTLNEYNKMRNQEIKILNKMGVELPYKI